MKNIESLEQLREMIDDWANHKLCSGNFVTKWEIDISQNMSGENKIYFIQKEIIEATSKCLKTWLVDPYHVECLIEKLRFVQFVNDMKTVEDRKHLQKIMNEPMTI